MSGQASAEVERLTNLKATRMKELVMKKRAEFEDICQMAHIEPDTSTSAEKSNALIDSGAYIAFSSLTWRCKLFYFLLVFYGCEGFSVFKKLMYLFRPCGSFRASCQYRSTDCKG